jgi:hypothetical protein
MLGASQWAPSFRTRSRSLGLCLPFGLGAEDLYSYMAAPIGSLRMAAAHVRLSDFLRCFGHSRGLAPFARCQIAETSSSGAGWAPEAAALGGLDG